MNDGVEAWATWLATLPRFPASPAPARMRGYLARFGDPQNAFDAVHIVGTNGKGSVAAIIESVARESGVRTGLFTSPHLHHFGERIRVDGAPIRERDLGALVEEIRDKISAPTALADAEPPTAFDVLTCAAFIHFARKRVDLAIIEAGLGGRLDSTNVLPRVRAAAVTSIGIDHADVLGKTREAILQEKLGIARVGGSLVTSERDPVLVAAIRARAFAEGASVIVAGDDITWHRESESFAGQVATFSGPSRELANVDVALLGDHQLANAAVAISLARHLRFDESAIRLGLKRVKWPARLEHIADAEGRAWLVDSAHNPEGVAAIGPTVQRFLGRGRVTVICGATAERDAREMARAFATWGLDASWVVTEPSSRPLPADSLARALAFAVPASCVSVARDAASAIGEVRASDARAVVVAGSTYLAGDVRALLLGRFDVASD